MPAGPDSTPDAPPPTRRPTLISDASDVVGFLDAPGLEPAALATAVHDSIDVLDVGSVLAVYNDHPAGHLAIAQLCERSGALLVAAMGHATGGTTFTLRKQG